jgi:hypothetical protein
VGEIVDPRPFYEVDFSITAGCPATFEFFNTIGQQRSVDIETGSAPNRTSNLSSPRHARILALLFLVTGRGLVIAPGFPASAYRFDSNQRVRVVRQDGESFECGAFFQIPFQSPPAKVLSFFCTLPAVSKESVAIGSEIWLIGKTESEVKIG